MILLNKTLIKNKLEINKDNSEGIKSKIQKWYSDEITKLNLTRLNCCQKNGGLFCIHGYYTRNIQVDHYKVPLNITRIKCLNCNKTHSILLKDIIPYSRFNADEINKALKNGDYDYNDDISYEVYYKVNRIKSIILQRFLILSLKINDALEKLITNSVDAFKLHIFQIHRGTVCSFLINYTNTT